MAALRSLTDESVVTAALRREWEMSQRPHRFISHLEGTDYADAVDAADAAVTIRDAVLYGDRDRDTRVGWASHDD